MEAGRPLDPGPFALLRTARSFRYALAGLRYLARTQPNFRVHLLVTVAALGMGVILGVSAIELAALLLTIGLVLVAEALNTALEAVVDLASPGVHPLARIAKDTAAAAVLIAAIVAVLVGIAVLGPRLLIRALG
jgi:diacylglycerol kinase (ATP)